MYFLRLFQRIWWEIWCTNRQSWQGWKIYRVFEFLGFAHICTNNGLDQGHRSSSSARKANRVVSGRKTIVKWSESKNGPLDFILGKFYIPLTWYRCHYYFVWGPSWPSCLLVKPRRGACPYTPSLVSLFAVFWGIKFRLLWPFWY